MVMNQTPTTRFVFRARTTWGRPTTRILESSVAMKMPTVVTVRTTHLYSKDKPPDYQAFPSLRLARYKTPMWNEASMFRVGTERDSPRTSPDQRSDRGLRYDAEFTLPSSHKSPISKTLITSFCPEKPVFSSRNASASE